VVLAVKIRIEASLLVISAERTRLRSALMKVIDFAPDVHESPSFMPAHNRSRPEMEWEQRQQHRDWEEADAKVPRREPAPSAGATIPLARDPSPHVPARDRETRAL
jgi:hypothetical protein